MNERYYLNRKWKYSENFAGSLLIEPMSEGIDVELPHTFSETTYNYINDEKLRAQCVYQRNIEAKEEWRGKRVIITFEGVAQKASVYVNGVNYINHENAGTPFDIDITSKLNFGEDNLLTVLVDSRSTLVQPPFVDNMPTDSIPFGGIYRSVYITVKEPISIEYAYYRAETTLPPDTKGMNRSKLSDYKIPGSIKSVLKLTDSAMKMAREHRLFIRQYLNDKEISYQPLGEKGETITATGPVNIWDLDSPTCYKLTTELLLDDTVVDVDYYMIGFRTAVFNQRGFYLNGRKVKIRGVVRYQSFPYVGYAMPDSIQRMDAKILKEELHVNAVRCCGEFPSPAFLDECDKRGILVWVEVPGYRNIGGEEFQKIHLKNVEEMIIQGRNHPCIFLWGTRINGSVSSELDAKAVRIAHSLDPSRATAGERIDTNMPLAEDVYSYTDFSYAGKASPLLTKGEVTSDMTKAYLVSGYLGESMPVKPSDSNQRKKQQLAKIAGVLDAQAFLDDVCGSFVMSMCDHTTLAENASEDGMVYHGIMDAFRNKKPAANVFSSQNNVVPELYIYPPLSGERERWDGFGDIYILTNVDSVKVYKDNVFIREYQKEDSPFGHMRHGPLVMNEFIGDLISDDDMNADQLKRIKGLLNQMAAEGISSFMVPGQTMDRIMAKLVYRTDRRQLMEMYEKYVSRSHEYKFEGIKNGKAVITKVVKPGKAKYLKTDISSLNLIERHTYDVIQIRIMVNNECGEILSEFGEPVIINTHGPVQVLGPAIIPLRGGMAGAYIRSIGKEGEATVTVSCGNLVSAKYTLNVLKSPSQEL